MTDNKFSFLEQESRMHRETPNRGAQPSSEAPLLLDERRQWTKCPASGKGLLLQHFSKGGERKYIHYTGDFKS